MRALVFLILFAVLSAIAFADVQREREDLAEDTPQPRFAEVSGMTDATAIVTNVLEAAAEANGEVEAQQTIESLSAALNQISGSEKRSLALAISAERPVLVRELPSALQAWTVSAFMKQSKELNLAAVRFARFFAGEKDFRTAAFLEAASETFDSIGLDSSGQAELGLMSLETVAILKATLNTEQRSRFEAVMDITRRAAERKVLAHANAELFRMAGESTEEARARVEAEIDAEMIAELMGFPFVDDIVDTVKSTAKDVVKTVSDGAKKAYETVRDTDIHKLSGEVAGVATTVSDIAGKVNEIAEPIAAITAPIPYLGAATRVVATGSGIIATGAGGVATVANLIHDNTVPGETVGHAANRAKNAVVDLGHKAVDFGKKVVTDPKGAMNDVAKLVGKGVDYCKKNPQTCMNAAAKITSTVARTVGGAKGKKIADAIDKGTDLANKAIDGTEQAKDLMNKLSTLMPKGKEEELKSAKPDIFNRISGIFDKSQAKAKTPKVKGKGKSKTKGKANKKTRKTKLRGKGKRKNNRKSRGKGKRKNSRKSKGKGKKGKHSKSVKRAKRNRRSGKGNRRSKHRKGKGKGTRARGRQSRGRQPRGRGPRGGARAKRPPRASRGRSNR